MAASAPFPHHAPSGLPLSAARKLQDLEETANKYYSDSNFIDYVQTREEALRLQQSVSSGEEAVAAVEGFAESLAGECNSLGARFYQVDNYDAAVFFLRKALELTTAGSPYFEATDPYTRLRLHAAAYTHLGCLEKKRGRFEAALGYLTQAAEIEKDAYSEGATAATAMNLCTVLSKLGRGDQLLEPAKLALRCVLNQRQEAGGVDGQILVVAFHNLGIAQEYHPDPAIRHSASSTYLQAMQVARQELGDEHPTSRIVAASLQRVSGTPPKPSHPLPDAHVAGAGHNAPARKPQPPPLKPQPPPVPQGRRAPRSQQPHSNDAGGAKRAAPPPPHRTIDPPRRRPPSQDLGFSRSRMTPVSKSSSSEGRREVPIARHQERMLHRQNKRAMRADREERQRLMAKRIFAREQQMKRRREEEIERMKREAMAKVMYERMCAGLRAEEVKRLRNSAKLIQRVYRGYRARAMVERWEMAAISIQSVVRSHQSRVAERIRREQLAKARAEELEAERRTKAAILIQRRARCWFAKRSLQRIKKAKALRRWYCARTVQRVYRLHRKAIEEKMMRKEAELRLHEDIKHRQINAAARKIQGWWLGYKTRQRVKMMRSDLDRQISAAVMIQSLVRGWAARQLAAELRVMKRKQEGQLQCRQDAAMCLQRFIRVILARVKLLRLQERKVYQTEMATLHKAARTIQRSFRVFHARCTFAELRELRDLQHAKALVIQRLFRRYIARCAVEYLRSGKKSEVAAITIQQQWRRRTRSRQYLEAERLHLEERLKRKEAERRTASAMMIQATFRGHMGRKIARELRSRKEYLSQMAIRIQCMYRVFVAKRELQRTRFFAFKVLEAEKEFKRRCDASLTIQRAVRSMQARSELRHRKKRRAAAELIQNRWCIHKAKKELAELKAAREHRIQSRAAVVIQRLVRRVLYKNELKRLEEYYSKKHREKMLAMRKEEAALMIQSVWRGHVDRALFRAMKRERTTMDLAAAIVQRAWRRSRWRGRNSQHLNNRRRERQRRENAALTLQKFWRWVLATEYVEMLREDHAIQTEAALGLQCWWRQQLARKVVAGKRVLRAQTAAHTEEAEAELEAKITLVQAFMRTKVSEVVRMRRTLGILQREIDDQRQYIRSIEYGAAVTIQAAYRGYAERMYVKELRREIAEATQRQEHRRQVEERAAGCIQRLVRRSMARMELHRRKKAALADAWAAREKYEAEEDPSDVVVSLFWEMEAVSCRATLREIEANKARRREAAVTIQCAERSRQARKAATRLRALNGANRAALVIQNVWREKSKRLHAVRDLKEEAAAIRIQSSWRRWVATVHVGELKRYRRMEVEAALASEEELDHAVVTLQNFWRLVKARRHTQGLAVEKAHRKEENRRSEAAVNIQRVFRGHADRRQVRTVQCKKAKLEEEDRNRKMYPANSDFSRFAGPFSERKATAMERDAAATRIQCCFRQRQARQATADRREKKRILRAQQLEGEAAQLIQGAWKDYSSPPS